MIRDRRSLLVLAAGAALVLASCVRIMHSGATTNAAATPVRWVATWSPAQSATVARPAAGTPDRVP